MGLSIAASLFSLPFFPSLPGNFFAAAYGILAFFIPGILFWAAILLADPRYRPDKIFLLGFAVLPFMTLALGFVLLKDFSFYVERYPFLKTAGRAGLSFGAIFLTVLELSALALLRSLIFKTGAEQPKTSVRQKAPPQGYIPILPPPEAMEYPSLAKTGEFEHAGSPLVRDRAEEAQSAGGLADHNETGEPEVLEPLDDDGLETLEAGNSTAGERPGNTGALDAAEDSDAGNAGDDNDGGGDDLERAISEAEEKAQLKTRARAVREKQGEDKEDRKRKARKGPYHVPVEGLLTQYPDGEYWIIDQATRDAAHTLKATLEEFHIQAEVTGIRKGPVITMFEILPAPGVKLSRIVNLQDNIALRLAASSVRIVAPIPGKHAVGIEVPNQKRNIVSFREIIEGELAGENGRKMGIPVVLGKDITGEAQTIDLVQTPHLLIAGATGSGKSVCVNSMILSILYQLPPQECRLILIDPKIVELKLYNDIPHLLTPVITEPKKAFQALQYCIYEMERRYACLDSMGVRDIKSYNRRIKERNIAAEHIPYIVVVIDEFADLMATTGKELESTVARLAAMSRAVGVHLVLATQRPSIDVITGLIKANIPTRIAFMVASKMDSRIIIDMVGAEKLLGKGDMLYAGVVDPFPIRMQGAFVSEEEVERVVDYVKSLGEPEYIDEEIFFDDEEDLGPSLFTDGDDPLYDKALELVMQQGKASASYIQRRLKIGYNRAARLVEEMEHKGIVGPAQGSKPRELLRGA
ncbi:MAG: DNA translocase FtsK [Spirochaetaceae bacterium]|jgi:S-DNA-T family DNA segregation ATPase FtsK/SpoIIIE|nr:DNA translocase FtsK [Spirochaetaceae bacterium]